MSHCKTILALGLAALFVGAGVRVHAAPANNEAPPPVATLSLMGTAVPCSDLERSIAFYTKGLGMTLRGQIDMPSGTEAPLMFPGGGPYIILFKPKADGAAVVAGGSLHRIILAVPDIKALEARLIVAGYHLNGPISEQAKYHVAVGQLQDPDGNHLELVQRLP